MTNEEASWLGEGGASTRAELEAAGLLATGQEAGLCHLPADVLGALHAYDVALDAGQAQQAPGLVEPEGYEGRPVWRLNEHDTDEGSRCAYSGTIAQGPFIEGRLNECPLGCAGCHAVYDDGSPGIYRVKEVWA
jgi:hypothetical protein